MPESPTPKPHIRGLREAARHRVLRLLHRRKRRTHHVAQDPAHAVVRLSGEITSKNAGRVADNLRNTLRPTPRTLEIDLQRVTFLDREGGKAFLPVLRAAQQHGTKVIVTHASAQARNTFERLGLTHLLDNREGTMPDGE
ncbi:STAS domain-containing protein [Streptomyces sp. NPDC001093]|uniref:STAS domain-containing protein n=1 Tax=Streptomyces sp. NPDC001093 TaxID=3154376 RepID=UPI00332CF9A4